MLSSLRTPELFHQMEQFQLPMAWRVCPAASAKRINVNSRGCQPTEDHRKTIPTLKGAHHQSFHRALRIQPACRQMIALLCGSFRADDDGGRVPWVLPTENHRKANPILKGSHHHSPLRSRRIHKRYKSITAWSGPFRADDVGGHVPWVTPTAIHAVRLRRTDKNHIHRVNIFTTHHTYPLARTHGYSCNAPSANLVLQSTTDWKDCPEALRLCAFAPLR